MGLGLREVKTGMVFSQDQAWGKTSTRAGCRIYGESRAPASAVHGGLASLLSGT